MNSVFPNKDEETKNINVLGNPIYADKIRMINNWVIEERVRYSIGRGSYILPPSCGIVFDYFRTGSASDSML